MLMGFSYGKEKKVLGGTNEQRLKLEFSLIRIISQLGLKVLYKPHPAADFKYLKNFPSVIGGKFERVWRRADMFLFVRPTCSAFLYALNLSRRIIMLDLIFKEECYILPEDHKYLCERVRLIPTEIKNGEIIVDEKSLQYNLF